MTQEQKQQEQMARQIRAIYNYKIGRPRALYKFILICFLASPVVGLIIGVLAAVRHALGW
jgi:hypothetical protein